MAGIFKKLSANDIKITPFEAHKQYDTTDLASIGASTASINWSGQNKSEFTTGSKKYYQIDKLYYRNYIRERAHRLELDDATYTTQERRLYQSASVLSLSQRTFGFEVQPESFELSGSKGTLQFDLKDDGFGNLYDVNKGKDNFPNEDYRILYIGPTQAFKRADLTIDYETGNQYVNDPFPQGYTRTVYDDSYFLNEVEYKNVNFVTSSNSGFYSIKTPTSHSLTGQNDITNPEFTIDTADVSAETAGGFAGGLVSHDGEGDAGYLFDNDLNTAIYISVGNGNRGGFVFDFGSDGKNLSRIKFAQANSDFNLTWRIEVSTDGTNYTTDQEATFTDVATMHTFDLNTVQVIKKLRLSQEADGAPQNNRPKIYEIDFFEKVVTPKPMPEEDKSVITIPHQPQFNFETNEDFTISFFYTFEKQDHINSTIDGDYFILTKEGTKTVASLPSEKTQDVSLRITGSSQIKTAPIGNQFPYRIYYKGNHPNPNTSSLFFERSDGENTQFVSSSFFLSGSTEKQKFVSCENDNGILTLKINDETKALSYRQDSPTLNKTVSNKANITLYNKPNPDGSYSNYIGLGTGQISQLMMWNQALSLSETANVSESIVGTPNVGNIFYDNGFAVITHPTYMDVFDGGELNTLKYKNTHLITENEYQCTMTEDEFEFTTNPTIRKIPFSDSEDIANFATGSQFKPYVTSVGLYDDDGNLLVVGKLGQPIKASSETDTTFVIRYDT